MSTTPSETTSLRQCVTEEFKLRPFDKATLFKKSSMKPLSRKRPTTKRLKWKRRFLTKKKMSDAWKKTHLQIYVVDEGVNTSKNAQHLAPLALHVANKTIMQTSAEVNHKKRKDIVHSKTTRYSKDSQIRWDQ